MVLGMMKLVNRVVEKPEKRVVLAAEKGNQVKHVYEFYSQVGV
jgi:hypothetical protein